MQAQLATSVFTKPLAECSLVDNATRDKDASCCWNSMSRHSAFVHLDSAFVPNVLTCYSSNFLCNMPVYRQEAILNAGGHYFCIGLPSALCMYRMTQSRDVPAWHE